MLCLKKDLSAAGFGQNYKPMGKLGKGKRSQKNSRVHTNCYFYSFFWSILVVVGVYDILKYWLGCWSIFSYVLYLIVFLSNCYQTIELTTLDLKSYFLTSNCSLEYMKFWFLEKISAFPAWTSQNPNPLEKIILLLKTSVVVVVVFFFFFFFFLQTLKTLLFHPHQEIPHFLFYYLLKYANPLNVFSYPFYSTDLLMPTHICIVLKYVTRTEELISQFSGRLLGNRYIIISIEFKHSRTTLNKIK